MGLLIEIASRLDCYRGCRENVVFWQTFAKLKGNAAELMVDKI